MAQLLWCFGIFFFFPNLVNIFCMSGYTNPRVKRWVRGSLISAMIQIVIAIIIGSTTK